MTRARSIDTSSLKFSKTDEWGCGDFDEDQKVIDSLVTKLNIAEPMVREIMFENDEHAWRETPRGRWQRMRRWVERNIKP